MQVPCDFFFAFPASLSPATVALLLAAVVTGFTAVLLRLTVSVRQPKSKSSSISSHACPPPPPPTRPRDPTSTVVCRLTARRRFLTAVYMVVWLIRCVLLTLTVGSLALRFHLDGDLTTVGRSLRELFHGRLTQEGAGVGGQVTADWDIIGLAEKEAERRGRRWKEMRDACESYTSDLADIALAKVLNHSFSCRHSTVRNVRLHCRLHAYAVGLCGVLDVCLAGIDTFLIPNEYAIGCPLYFH